MLSLLLMAILGISTQDQANADVAVIVACIQVAESQEPELPVGFHRGRFKESPEIEGDPAQSVPVVTEDSVNAIRIEELETRLQEALNESSQIRERDKAHEDEIERLKKEIEDSKAAQSNPEIEVETPEIEGETVRSRFEHSPKLGLLLEPDESQKTFGASPQEYELPEIVIFTGEDEYGKGWCPNCHPYIHDMIKKNNIPGLIIRESSAKAPLSQEYPAVRWMVDGHWYKPWKNFKGKVEYDIPESPKRMKAWLDAGAKKKEHVASASGSGGTIHAKQTIKYGFNFIAENLGYDNEARIEWSRSGAQSFNVLKMKGQFSAERILGRSGRVTIVTKSDMSKVSVNRAGFSYNVVDDNIVFDIDPITVKGLAKRFGFNDEAVAGGYGDYGENDEHVPQFGITTAMTVFSFFQSLWSVLHPQADIKLGGNVACSAILRHAENGQDRLDIKFTQCPEIQIVFIMTALLGVKEVTVTEDNVHVVFSGSMFIKSRDFRISDDQIADPAIRSEAPVTEESPSQNHRKVADAVNGVLDFAHECSHLLGVNEWWEKKFLPYHITTPEHLLYEHGVPSWEVDMFKHDQRMLNLIHGRCHGEPTTVHKLPKTSYNTPVYQVTPFMDDAGRERKEQVWCKVTPVMMA